MAAKILVVDDQASMCWILAKILEEVGLATEASATGKEALSTVTTGDFAAAIIDYRLPDMNGIQLFRQMQGREVLIPAFLITSYGSKTLHHEALKVGFRGYFDKPFSNQKLVDAILAALA